MLETRGLVKIYRPKKGVPVKALDGVSLKFPDKGMIFLLGKSGSGKSTLLNVLGGLDKYDGGEIIIKEVSSKDFKQQHFDSYRNTYVGFIFQEYNILEEFTVGANIALALELQGRKATDEEINRILREVDLDGYGNRRPNELSGGQKQRVAIARALVKNPKIIMADEPSGALDSATGKQVFETLKKLSKEKLVIVVSHDRDFASEYADRIIELADGKVISDTTLCEETEDASVGIAFEGTVARIPLGYRLTEEDRIAINEYIEKLQSGAELEFINKTASKKFAPTEQDKIKNEDKTPFKLIKSKLSLKHAFKIGSSGLKHKKFRLVMTVILSCIAFILFGLVDTFSSYNHINACTDSIYDSNVTYASLVKSIKRGEGIDSYWYSYGTKISKEDIASLESDTGVDFKGVVAGRSGHLAFSHNTDYSKFSNLEGYGSQLYAVSFSGIVEINEDDMEKLGYSVVAGHLPNGAKNEIAISKYVCDTFIKGGFRSIYDETYAEIDDYSDMVGRVFNFNRTDYTVSGVIDTKLDWDRYAVLLEDDTDDDTAEMLLKYALYSEFNSAVEYNFTGMAMVGEGGLEKLLENQLSTNDSVGTVFFELNGDEYIHIYPSYLGRLSDVAMYDIDWLDGKQRTALGEKEIIISRDMVEYCFEVEYNEDMTGFTYDPETILNASLDAYMYKYNSGSDMTTTDTGYKIVGILNDPSGAVFDTVVINDSIFKQYVMYDGEYDYALGAMPEGKGGIKELVAYCYDEEDNVRFELQNPACFELDAMHEVILVLSDIFLYVGIGFAVFAAILLSNFIATSISYKKQEIGILRAIGSRGNDVFRIFFAEAFIIAMINFVLACLGTGAIVAFINSLLRTEVGLLVTFLNFGIRQILLLFVISVAVAAIASFLPVKKIASKKPIDAIRNR